MKKLILALVALLIVFPSQAKVINYSLDKVESKKSKVLHEDFFGIHFHRLWVKPNENAIPTVWPPLKFGMLRLWDSGTNWADIEPTQGNWNFSRFDFYVNEAASRSVKVIYPLGATPRWASARPDERCSYGLGCAAEPKNLDYWREYVRVVARRYRGRVCCYEVWNEPDFSGPPKDPNRSAGFYTGTVETMVEMARIARDVLREEDPNAVLLSPSIVNGPYNRLDKFLGAGGSKFINGIAYHFYASNDERRLLHEIELVRAVMSKNSVSHLELWNTETGVEVISPDQPLPPGLKKRVTREEAAALMTRQIVLAAFSGINRYVYYAWDNDRSGMVDRSGNYHPSRDAMLLLQRWLLGAKLGHCDVGNGDPTICWGEKQGVTFSIVWNATSSEPIRTAVPTGLEISKRQVAVRQWTEAASPQLSPNIIWSTPNPTWYEFRNIVKP